MHASSVVTFFFLWVDLYFARPRPTAMVLPFWPLSVASSHVSRVTSCVPEQTVSPGGGTGRPLTITGEGVVMAGFSERGLQDCSLSARSMRTERSVSGP